MAIGNTPTRETNITVEANRSFAFGIWFKAEDGTPIDLTDSVLRFVASEMAHFGGTEVLSSIATPMADNKGMMQFEFQASDLALTPSTYAYDVTLVPPSGYSTPILKGHLVVGNNTDEDISNIYQTGVSTGADVTVYLKDRDVVEIKVERVDGLFMFVTELIHDFRDEIAENQALMDEKVASAQASAQLAYSKAEELRGWFNSVGFPFWKGTQAQYDAIPVKDPNVLYLITA